MRPMKILAAFIVGLTVASCPAVFGSEDFLVAATRPPAEEPGLCFLEPDRQTVLVVPDDAGPLVEHAAELLRKNIERSTQYRPEIFTEEEALSKGFLAHAVQLARVGRSLPKNNLRDTFTIQASRDWGRNVIRISSPTERGLVRGAAELLRRTMNAEWFPPRTHHWYFAWYNDIPQDCRMKITTYLVHRERLVWPDALNPLSHSDLFQDQGLLVDRYQVHPSLIDWCLLHGIDLLAVYLQASPYRDLPFVPVEGDEINRLRSIFDYAHEREIRVVLFDFPFVCSPRDLDAHPEVTGQSLDANGHRTGKEIYRPELELTRRLSTEYFERLTEELGADGLAFHPSSEMVRKTPVPEGEPPFYWDLMYIQDYFRNFHRRKPNGATAVVSGWVFMDNPADLRPHLPPETIAWVVPGKEETERHILQYHTLFPCWHWLYVFYSSEGIHARLAGRGEYTGLRRRVNDALALGARGVVPEAYMIRNHEAPLLYLTALYRSPDLDITRFNADFCAKFFNHASKATLGWEAYWKEQYGYAFQYFSAAYGKAREPIIRDHIRDMALSSLYLGVEKSISSPPGGSRKAQQEFLEGRKKAMDDALETLVDPFASQGQGDIWDRVMEELKQRN